MLKTQAVLTKEAVSTAIAAAFGSKQAAKAFQKLLDSMGE